MKYTSVYVNQLVDRKYKPWQARAKYKDANGRWKETGTKRRKDYGGLRAGVQPPFLTAWRKS